MTNHPPVQRYDIGAGYLTGSMNPDKTGDWVTFKDFDRVERENAALVKALDEASCALELVSMGYDVKVAREVDRVLEIVNDVIGDISSPSQETTK